MGAPSLKLADAVCGVRVYTTGRVARLCQANQKTVSRWIDSGRLKGYRIPGSDDRRVYADELAAFMRAHGMRLPPELKEPTPPVFAVGLPAGWVPGVAERTPFALGQALAAVRADGPAVGAVVFGGPLGEAAHLAALVRAADPRVRLAAVVGDDRDPGDVPAGAFDLVFREAGGPGPVAAWLLAGVPGG